MYQIVFRKKEERKDDIKTVEVTYVVLCTGILLALCLNPTALIECIVLPITDLVHKGQCHMLSISSLTVKHLICTASLFSLYLR